MNLYAQENVMCHNRKSKTNQEDTQAYMYTSSTDTDIGTHMQIDMCTHIHTTTRYNILLGFIHPASYSR